MEVRRGSAQSGFTLIESMVGLTILLIGLLALAMLQNVAFRANTAGAQPHGRHDPRLAADRAHLSRLGSANVSTGTGTSDRRRPQLRAELDLQRGAVRHQQLQGRQHVGAVDRPVGQSDDPLPDRRAVMP